MNIKIKTISLLCLVILSGVYLSSCKKMDDSYRQFVDKGETIYIAKADSIKIYGGRNRVEVTWLLLSDPKVTKYKLFWNNRRDSVEKSVTKTGEVDTVKAMLTNMSEGTYFFDIYLYDKLGNSSVKSTKSGRVYGERFQSSLLTRAYRSITRSGTNVNVEWMPADTAVKQVDLQYTDAAGELKKITVTNKTRSVTPLVGMPVNGFFRYRTVFEPEKKALDLFYTDYTTVQLTL
jgi:ribosomal protein L13